MEPRVIGPNPDVRKGHSFGRGRRTSTAGGRGGRGRDGRGGGIEDCMEGKNA